MKRLIILIFIFNIPFNIFAQLPLLIPYREGDKWGFVDSLKKIKIKPIYDETGYDYDDFVVKYTKDGVPFKETIVTYYTIKDGRKSIVDPVTLELGLPPVKALQQDAPPALEPAYHKVESIGDYKSYQEKMAPFLKYDNHFAFNKDFYLISKNDKNAIADKNGTLISKYYDSIILQSLTTEVIVKNDGKYGKLNYVSQLETVPVIYEYIYCWNDLYTSFKLGKKVGMYKSTKIILEPKYDNLQLTYSNYNAFFVTKVNGKCGLIDSLGKMIVSTIYDTVFLDNHYNTIWVKQSNKYFLFNKNNGKISQLGYDEVESNCNPKLIAFKQGNKFGFINSTGKIIFQPIFDSVEEWSSYSKPAHYNSYRTRVLVKINICGKFGYIDYKGNKYWKN